MLHIFWFRKDLRLTDNRALGEFINAIPENEKFLFLYVKNSNTYRYFGEKRIGFLYESLIDLKEELEKSGFHLVTIEGKSRDVFKKLKDKYKNISVYCNSQVEPYCRGRDEEVKSILNETGNEFHSFTDTTLFEPGEILNGEGNQYKVYTPFKNQCLNVLKDTHFKKIDSDPGKLNPENEEALTGFDIIDLNSELKKINRSDFIKGGRQEGLKLLKDFYENGIIEYKSKRDFPSVSGTSLISSHLHFGNTGIREAFRTAFVKLKKANEETVKNEIQTWINELLWREFYYNITFHNPAIMFESFKKECDNIRWNYDKDIFEKWCQGKTGYPIVDAGMRQLVKEGWMHNRVRMVTAMFLTKDLLTDWRWGEKFFAEHLIDLDFSSNNGGWQWSASTGVDAQPYFRIFNPYLQSKKFDQGGIYIRKYVPELRTLPAEFIHNPSIMNEDQQKFFGVLIDKDYPSPIVEHFKVRDEVLKRFKEALN
ncbi:MAG TPA: deoxyribodipyrimidine photo-lyase [Ignavibacteria bacterium]|nr:deoxyribodipyrimidine photo-lyase [Ignavibacteria bacterium]HMR39091.1 deoxyribodipyrimidine photo-lyase [Ignavibacteria bacterium]